MRFGISSPPPGSSRRVGSTLHVRRWLAALIAILVSVIGAGGPARASTDHIDVGQVALEAHDDGYYFNGDFDFDLRPRIAEALDRGLTLYFAVEVQLTRSRWYWFDEKAIDATLSYRLSYHALTRQYRVSTGNLQLGYPTLAEALGVMTHVREWKVAERPALRLGATYSAAARMRLDTTQLPKPFQINAITNRDWTLESDWKRFVFEPR